jgi:hypothetical protein
MRIIASLILPEFSEKICNIPKWCLRICRYQVFGLLPRTALRMVLLQPASENATSFFCFPTSVITGLIH